MSLLHGAGVIAGIEDHEVLGVGKAYYVLKMPLGNMKVMIPVDNAENIGLRALAAPGLPGRYAPYSAALLIRAAVYGAIRELEE